MTYTRNDSLWGRRSTHIGKGMLFAFVAFVALAGVVLAAPVALVHVASAAETNVAGNAALTEHNPLVGAWRGVIDIPGQPLDVKFVLVEQPDGVLSGTIDIPAQGAVGLQLKDIELVGDRVRFAFVDIPAAVDGALSDDALSIEGTFHQAGMDFPFHAERELPTEANAEQLDAIRTFIETAMDAWHVPGVAVAIVQNGAVVMADGFGLRDVERELPVTATTLFGIGSSTKAFTSTAFQMLVDEGALDWDRPLREVIPGFRLYDPFATEHATALDFALHRSGLPRHDILWMANPGLDAGAAIAAAQHLQPSAGFRETWMYNNFGYVLLGHLIEQASGQSWADFVTERILRPLDMQTTNFTIEAMQATDDFSLAYTVGDDEWESVPLSELGAAAAAGAINSNAVDMGQWLLFQLNKGRVGDEELVSATGIQRMRTPHIVMGGGEDAEINFAAYGPGWMLDSYRGHYRVHHGGNTIGFSADVAFVPSAGIGVAVLTNGLFTPLPTVVTHYVLDTLLGLEPIDWSGRLKAAEAMQAEAMHMFASDVGRRAGTSPSHDVAEYVGVYEHPAYGRLEITAADDRLEAVYYDAVMALEHWHFDQFRGRLSPYIPMEFPFLFETDAAGEIAKVYVGFEATVDAIPFVRRAGAELQDPNYLQQFVGKYDLMGGTIDVSLRNGVLVLTVPGQPPYHLEPTREGQFVFRDIDGFGVHFVYGDDGAVVKAILIQPQGNVELMRK